MKENKNKCFNNGIFLNSDSNSRIPIVIGVVSGIGITIVGVALYFALSKYRKGNGHI